MAILPDNRLTWVLSTGASELKHGAAAANGATYYAEVPVGAQSGPSATGFAVSLVWDATEATLFTLESCNDPDLTTYAAAGTGWKSQATALGTLTAATSATSDEWQVADVQAKRWRIKRVVTTGGVATARYHVKGN